MTTRTPMPNEYMPVSNQYWPQHPVAEARPDGSLSVTNADGTKVVIASGEGCSVHDGVMTAIPYKPPSPELISLLTGMDEAAKNPVFWASLQGLTEDGVQISSPSAEIAVTDEMIEAGKQAFERGAYDSVDGWFSPESVYRAMVAMAPDRDAFVLANELSIACFERDAAVARADLNAAAVADLERKLMEAREKEEFWWRQERLVRGTLVNACDECRIWHDRAVAAEARMTALEPPPDPKPNPFREHPDDRRRLGGSLT